MSADPITLPGADFQALSLEAIIAQPLKAVVAAQNISAQSTIDFIKSFCNTTTPAPADGAADQQAQSTQSNLALTPITVTFDTSVIGSASNTNQKAQITVPLLSIVPIPNLKIDSFTIDFKYEVTQTVVTSRNTLDRGDAIDAGAKGLLGSVLNTNLSGHITSTSKQESTTNRSGVLGIQLHASEAAMPEGLAKVLKLLANSVSMNVIDLGGSTDILDQLSKDTSRSAYPKPPK